MATTLAERIVEAWEEIPEWANMTHAEIAIAIVVEEAAKMAESKGVEPDNLWQPSTDWYKHGRAVAAAIRKMKD